MAKRSGFVRFVADMQREAERTRRANYQAQQRAIRDAERARREQARWEAQDDRERQREYVEDRIAETEELNQKLAALEKSLSCLLLSGKKYSCRIDFQALKVKPKLPVFNPGDLANPQTAPRRQDFVPSPLGWAQRKIPGATAKWEAKAAEGQAAYANAAQQYEKREIDRQGRLAAAKAKHDVTIAKLKSEADEKNRQIDEFWIAVQQGDPEALVEYFVMVLNASPYPMMFPREYRAAYVPESKQLVVECRLPDLSIVPEAKQHKYVKARDVIEAVARPVATRRALYAQVVAQMALRTVDEVFRADESGHVETVALNAYVETIDRATGKDVKPYLVTLRTTREVFQQVDLAKVEPSSCLKGLNASVSKSPAELAPVRPVVEFNMVDSRFVEETDVLSGLDQRPNLMELTPVEFESLITNLFEKIGLETRLTQASRDGGVDCVAFDPRPIMGGKVVIQAKRYKNTVGVSAVRDLYGTMMNEGASKGILVTTSGYGKAAFEFAEGKPIELLSGSNLLYLLKEHADMEAKIEMPEGWVDPL